MYKTVRSDAVLLQAISMGQLRKTRDQDVHISWRYKITVLNDPTHRIVFHESETTHYYTNRIQYK